MLCSLFLLASPLRPCGAEDAAPPSPPVATQEGISGSASHAAETAVDKLHARLCDRLQKTTLWLDTRFGSEQLDDRPMSGLRLRLLTKIEDWSDVSVSPKTSVRMALPILQQRFHLYVDNIRHDLLPGADPEKENGRFSAGTRWTIRETLKSCVDLRGGIDLKPEPVPWGTLRFRYAGVAGPLTTTFSQEGFWNADDRFGEMTEVDFDLAISDRVCARSVSAVKRTQENEGYETEQTLLLGFILKKERQFLKLRGSVFGMDTVAQKYVGGITYRTRFCKPWLFLEITPQVEFPREKDFKDVYFIYLGVDLFFGRIWGNASPL